MSYTNDDHFEGLSNVEDALRRQRPTAEPLELDQIKLRAITKARKSPRTRGFAMRSRLAAVLTCAFVGLGTTGAIAWSGNQGGGGSHGGSGGYEQYRPPCHDGSNWDGHGCHRDHHHGHGHWQYGHHEGWDWNGSSYQYSNGNGNSWYYTEG
jgi:hypothetical protein